MVTCPFFEEVAMRISAPVTAVPDLSLKRLHFSCLRVLNYDICFQTLPWFASHFLSAERTENCIC